MNDKTTWEEIKEYYKYTFRIENELVELMADFDIVLLCATGASNKKIAEFFEVDESDVKSILGNRIKFGGWELDLPLNPYNIYTSMVGKFDSDEKFKVNFKSHKLLTSKISDKETIDLIYFVCKSCRNLEFTLELGWN
jgi:hypothetical protein